MSSNGMLQLFCTKEYLYTQFNYLIFIFFSLAWYEELPLAQEPTPHARHQLGQAVDPGH